MVMGYYKSVLLVVIVIGGVDESSVVYYDIMIESFGVRYTNGVEKRRLVPKKCCMSFIIRSWSIAGWTGAPVRWVTLDW